VDFVRDRQQAQIHLLVFRQITASRGFDYTLEFLGRNEFSGRSDTLSFIARATNTADESRRGLARIIKIGLVPFVARTPMISGLLVEYESGVDVLPEAPPEDPWNNWVIGIRGTGRFSGEQASTSRAFSGRVTAERITETLKIEILGNGGYRESRFELDSEKVVSTRHSASARALVARSMDRHWSIGGFARLWRSTYRNIDAQASLAPAVEYNFYPYAEASKRELRVLYRPVLSARSYLEETLFGKLQEVLFSQSLSITMDIKKPWGSVETELEGSHYLHDFSKHRLSWSGDVRLRAAKGLSIDLGGIVSVINDQIELPGAELTEEEILLQQKQLATSYRYSTWIGISYTFGSIYNNIINPRFE
jgi:hypothetical protein